MTPDEFGRLTNGVPTRLVRLLAALIRCVESHGEAALLLHGSIIKGGVDAYSDVDVTVVFGLMSQGDAMTVIADCVSEEGAILSQFSAEHIGRANTLVLYVEMDGTVVKLDAAINLSHAAVSVPAEAILLHDSFGAKLQVVRERTPEQDKRTLFVKLCGWLWFTYGKIARGELFAAGRSIDFSREAALLPIMQARLGLPGDGHRRIEQRLPESLLSSLTGTYPTELTRDRLFAALKNLKDLTLCELRMSGLDDASEIRNNIQVMWGRIEQDALGGCEGRHASMGTLQE